MQEQINSGDPAKFPRYAHRKVVSFPGSGRGSAVLIVLLYFVGATGKFDRSDSSATGSAELRRPPWLTS